MSTKILFLDLDGTLLNDQKEITDPDRTALYDALAMGHRVVINTGRPLSGAIAQNKSLGLTKDGCYIVAFNGGMVYDPHREQVLFRQCIPMDTALKIIRLVDSFGLHVQAYDDENVLVEPHNDDDAILKYCQRVKVTYRVVEDFSAVLQDGTAKILAISHTDRPALEQLQTAIRETCPEVDCFFSCREFLEIVPKNVHKGNALRSLCHRLGFAEADSVAAGDEANDIAMLEAAGIGCAMANAVDSVKEIADYITQRDNNHGGVAEIVEKFLLSENK